MTLAEPRSAIESELRRKIAKLERINAALMTHVERVTDQPEGAYSLFQTAIMLDARVRNRTEELTGLMHKLERSNEALEAARDDAERANRLKTRFLAAASHDLLQPLNATRLSISTLADLPLDPAATAIVHRVERGLESIEELIKTLLDISKLDAGVVQPHLAPVRMRDLLGGIASGFQPAAKAKGLRLTLRCPSDLITESDANLLKRIIGNLISNAVRYTERGGILLAARTRGSGCHVDVIDTGRGIPAAERDLVFEEFFRGRSALGELGEDGLGLGLSIVRRIAHTLGHEIGFSSRVARGTWFKLALPLFSHPPPQPILDLSLTSSLLGIRALVVENDPPTLAATTRLLEGWGMIVRAVADPRAIVVSLEIEPFDVLLADYHLGPGLFGTEIVAALRASVQRVLPAVVITADHSDDVRARVTAADCSLVNKPVKPAQLRSLLSYLCG